MYVFFGFRLMHCILCISEGFYLPASLNQLHLHPPSAPASAPSSSTPPQRMSRDGMKDRHYRGERERDKERERLREEQRPHSVVDLTQEGRSEEERRVRSRDREQERERERDIERDVWSFHPHHHQQKSHSQPSTAEPRSRHSPPRPSFSSGVGGGAGRFHGPETDREGLNEDHHNHNLNANSNNTNSQSDKQRRNDSVTMSAGTLHISYAHPAALQSSASGPQHSSTPRDIIKEQRVSAPTYVPSVEVYDERTGPIQIASQARDNKHRDRERDRNRERESYRFPEKGSMEPPRLSGDSGNQREEGSVICSNGSICKRGQDVSYSSGQSRFSPDTRDIPKNSLRLGIERAGTELKWNTINYATNHMAALAAQHGHTLSSPQSQQSHTQISPHTTHRTSNSSHSTHSHSPQTHASQHGHGHAAEEGSQKRYLDPPALYRAGGSLVMGSGGGERVRGAGSDPKEVSAMQSLIKYSGNFAAEGPGSSRYAADGRGPFGGLGNINSETEREKEREKEREREREKVSIGSGALRVPPQLKREQERPDSARSFSREGEGEVRHPPVGIAVAVARQRDSGSSSKQTSGPSDTQRTHLQTSIKGDNNVLYKPEKSLIYC